MTTLTGKDADKFLKRMLATEKRKPTKKEKELARRIFENFSNALVCNTCGQKIYNYSEISEHASKEHHYEYKNPKSKLILSVV